MFLPSLDDGMSQHHMYFYLKLTLGLHIPALFQPSPVCPRGQNHDFHGYHRLNCKENKGRANLAARDVVAQALKRECQRLGINFVDHDHEMHTRYGHLTSQKTGDLGIVAISKFQIYDLVSRQPCDQAIAEVKMVS